LHPRDAQLAHILLHDGALHTSDILQWRLDARLAVLAACDTAVGSILAGDEQMGLPHAFLIAGAETVLASLWTIDDQMAADFLTAFYDELNTTGVPSTALRHTRKRIYDQAPQPLHWGAFVLIGNG
jgi:CHAT domain-containing protein